jgi:hypothetical protein
VKPIRLKRDDVVHTVHTAQNRVRLATAADMQKTVANPNGFGWPSCWVCTEKRMQERGLGIMAGESTWVSVEGYGIIDQRADEEDLRAECTHGNPGGKVYEETKILTMPKKWSETKKRLKRAGLVFFVGASATPMGGNIVLL